MGPRLVSSLVWAVLVYSVAGHASAMYTMTMTITPPSFRDSLNSTMGIELVNTGDEIAYKGTVQIMHPMSLKADPVIFDVLQPNVTEKKTVEVSAAPHMKPGTYPLVVSLQFLDRNNYPIYMIFETVFDVDKPSATKVFGQLSETSFPADGTGTLTLRIKNMDLAPHSVKTRLLLPASITADRMDDLVEVGPQSEAKVDYQVTNFMALGESNFMALATMEYEDDQHHTATSRGRVMITQGGQSGPPLIFPAAAAIVFLGVIGYAVFKMGGYQNAMKWLRKGKKRKKNMDVTSKPV